MWYLFKQLGRMIRYIFLGSSGAVEDAADRMLQDPNVAKAGFNRAIEALKEEIRQYTAAIAESDANRRLKVQELATITEEIKKVSLQINGAQEQAKAISNKFKAAGKTKEDLIKDPEFLKVTQFLKQFTARLDDLQSRAAKCEESITRKHDRIEQSKLLAREKLQRIAQLEDERDGTVTDLRGAAFEKREAQLFAGISEKKVDEDLDKIRRAREKALSDADINVELSGMEAKAATLEFEKMAREKVVDSQLLKDLGWEEQETPAAAEAVAEKTGGDLPT